MVSDGRATHGAGIDGPVDPSAVARGIERGLAFLARRQLPSGQFPVEQTMRDGATGVSTVQPDETPFATAHIAFSLGHTAHPTATAMTTRALAFLRREQHGPGLWRHWNRTSPRHASIPLDADDTACISHVLRLHGVVLDNASFLLFNRDRRGLFQTWLIPRMKAGGGLRYWRMALGDLNAARAIGFWKLTSARHDDVDGAVNANVLLYLGDRPETRPVVDFLIRIVDTGSEATCDKWYHAPSVFWYVYSRAFHRGVVRLGERRAVILERIAARDGLDRDALSSALNSCTLLNFGDRSPTLDAAIDYLTQTQHDDGGWPSHAFYHGGRGGVATWGSRELTTGFCIEALSRYGGWRAASA